MTFMEGRRVTALRTAAAAAIGAKYLARPESKLVGIIGTGEIGWTSLAALNESVSVEKICAKERSGRRIPYFSETS